MFVFSLLGIDHVSILGKHELSELSANVNLFFVTRLFCIDVYEGLDFFRSSL